MLRHDSPIARIDNFTASLMSSELSPKPKPDGVLLPETSTPHHLRMIERGPVRIGRKHQEEQTSFEEKVVGCAGCRSAFAGDGKAAIDVDGHSG
jgi:hypothetical protein